MEKVQTFNRKQLQSKNGLLKLIYTGPYPFSVFMHKG